MRELKKDHGQSENTLLYFFPDYFLPGKGGQVDWRRSRTNRLQVQSEIRADFVFDASMPVLHCSQGTDRVDNVLWLEAALMPCSQGMSSMRNQSTACR